MAGRKTADSTRPGAFAPAVAMEPKGFACSASRTVATDVDRVFAAWTDDKRRRQWCRNDQLVITETTPSISLHGTWGSSHLRVYVMPRGALRTMVTVDHVGLPTARKAEQMKKFWQARLARLAVAAESTRA
jgi:uncharacterized protein YndB with AHSA1/START domain